MEIQAQTRQGKERGGDEGQDWMPWNARGHRELEVTVVGSAQRWSNSPL